MLTAWTRAYALRHSIIDVPNQRSAHEQPTPRGGGLAIVAVVTVLTCFIAVAGMLQWRTAVAIVPAAAAVALVGWVDDRRGVPPLPRFAVHLLAAAWATAWLGGLPGIRMAGSELELGLAGSVLAVIAIVWSTNVYNFMDGIDGLAGVEAAFAGAVGGFLLLVDGITGLGALAVGVAAAALGFLSWNLPPAKIFMGDVGSGFLGFMFGATALASERLGGPPLTVWLLLLAVFVFDGTVTLARRMLARRKWHLAHRSHAYQRAAQVTGRHRPVLLAVAGLNVALAAIAVGIWKYPARTGAGVLAAMVLLASAYIVVERLRPMRETEGVDG